MSAAPLPAGPFVVYGKTEDTRYSVRTAQGVAICTCAYIPALGFSDDRQAMAQYIADALNAYTAALAKATGGASTPTGGAES